MAPERGERTPEHFLLVGATGMLRGAALHLATRPGGAVSSLARTPARLRQQEEDARSAGGVLSGFAVDYRDSAALREAIQRAQETHGEVSAAICWIHSDAPEGHRIVAEVLSRQKLRARYFAVLSSAWADPTRPARALQLEGVDLRRVILGFVIEPGVESSRRSRWLTDEEISAGVLGALESDRLETIVGTVEPWSARP
jgi:hypothetical protein